MKIYPVQSNTEKYNQNRDTNEKESFPVAMATVIKLVGYCGTFPRKSKPKTLWTVFMVVFISIVTWMSFKHMFRTLNKDTLKDNDGISQSINGAVFYGCCLMSLLMLWYVSRKWDKVCDKWSRADRKLSASIAPQPISAKISLISILVSTMAIMEHLLSMVNGFPRCLAALTGNLSIAQNISFPICFQEYMENSHGFFFETVPYSWEVAILILIVSNVLTVVWNFQDLFIILISMGLTARYQQLNKFVREIAFGNTELESNEGKWKLAREYFAVQVDLVIYVDNLISPIILLSFMNNVYFIVVQMLNGFGKKTNLLGGIYFFFSFALVCIRAIWVCLSAASVNDCSRKSLPYIYLCPDEQFNKDVDRLHRQVSTHEVALSGMRLFYLTKNFLLALIGAISTYEIILFQFRDSNKDN